MIREAKKILITGGTGFIGKYLCDRLLKDGYNLYILTRNKKLKRTENLQKKLFINNFSEIQNIDIDIVINLSGETISQRWTKDAKSRIYNSRIAATRDLVNFMGKKKTKPTLFLSASAVGYYGVHDNQIFTEENDPEILHSEFARSVCREWENEACRAEDLCIRTVRLRIGPVLEKDGGILKNILPAFRLGLGGQISNGRQWLSWIDRDDLIELIIFIINHEKINGPVNATSPNPVTNKEFSLELAKVLNRSCLLKTPGIFLKLIFGQMAQEIVINGQKVLPDKATSHGFKFSYPTIQQSLLKIFSK